jgi:predicted metal-dependent enzyme (double-stranded beta helix superfamily)
MATVFDVDDFVDECHRARAEAEPRLAVRNVLGRALRTPDSVASVLDPQEGGLTMLYHDDELTVLHVVWAPGMTIVPHDHRMWAVIGIYAGQEDNVFYRRPGPDSRSLVESGGKALTTGDVAVLGDDTIHGVTNPRDRLTGAIHVYGGDFVRQPRSQWGPGALIERPYDLDQARQHFADANAAWLARED